MPRLNDLPNMIRQGTISKENAVKTLWGEVYSNPRAYGLRGLTDDQKSDLLLHYKDRFERLFDTYDENRGKFSTYVYSWMQNCKVTWKLKLLRAHSKQICESKLLGQNYLDTYDSYEKNAFNLESEKNVNNINTSKFHRLEKSAKKVIHFLTLKACNELSDETIAKISAFLNLGEGELERQIQEVKLESAEKVEKRKEIIYIRNRAYYFRKKHLRDLLRIIPGTLLHRKTLKAYRSQSARWIKYNALLAERFSESPSNETIAKIAKTNPRQVSFYLTGVLKRQKTLKDSNEIDQNKNDDT